jgi:glutaredoxin
MKTLLLLLLLFAFGYSGAYTVTIYGTPTCGYTTDLRNQCTANNIQFTFCDVNESKCVTDFYNVVYEFNLATDSYVDLPVVLVVVDGKRYGMVRPTIAKIKQLIGTTSAIMIGNKIDMTGDIYNSLGVRVKFSGDINSLPPGFYILRGKEKVVKFVKN